MSLDYKAGDIILDNCNAFVKALHGEFTNAYCNNCFAMKGDLKSCTSCRLFKYCDKTCQAQDWNAGHKVECKSQCFRHYCHEGINVDVKIILFRMYAMLKLNPDSATKPFPLHDKTTRCFNDLMSHQESVAKDLAMRCQGEAMAMRLNEEDPGNMVEVDYLLRLLGISQTNSFGIYNESQTSRIGLGIFIEPSVFDHSCKPNAQFLNKGIQLQIRAIGPVPKGEQPHISYLTDNLNKAQRRRLLQVRYNFQCLCEMCESGSDSGVDYGRLKFLVAGMKRVAAFPSGNWQELYCQHQEILKMFRQIYHEYDERITNQLNRAMTIAMALNPNKQTLKGLFEEALDHLLITYGEDHLDYKEFQEKIAPFFN